MQELTHFRDVKVGDVLQVHWQRVDAATRKKYLWKFFAIVMEASKEDLKVYRLAARKGTKPIMHFYDPAYDYSGPQLNLLTDDEWPDGVWQERTRLILDGTIDINI